MINNDKIRIRQAVPEDVDAVTDVLLVSMPQDRDWWDYRFPHRDEHPDEHRRFFRRLVEAWISPEFPDWVLMVAEVCALEDEATGTYRVGAYAAWDISYLNYRTFGPGYKPRDRMVFLLFLLPLLLQNYFYCYYWISPLFVFFMN